MKDELNKIFEGVKSELLTDEVKDQISTLIEAKITEKAEEKTDNEKAFKKLFDYLTFNTIPEKKEFQTNDIVNAENLGLL